MIGPRCHRTQPPRHRACRMGSWRHRLHDQREAFGQVVARPAIEPHPLAILAGYDPEKLGAAPGPGRVHPCRSPAVAGRRRCRMHGGAEGSGGPKGARNGNYKHGRYTAETIATRRWVRDQIREVRALTKRLRHFSAGDDPVRHGLVASLARPGGNLTGINFFTVELAAKRLEVLRELVPGAARVAVLVNPANAVNTEATLRDVETAARAMGLQIQILNASHQPGDRCGLRERLRASGPMLSSSAQAPPSPVGAFNWPFWRRATKSPRSMRDASTMSRPAG